MVGGRGNYTNTVIGVTGKVLLQWPNQTDDKGQQVLRRGGPKNTLNISAQEAVAGFNQFSLWRHTLSITRCQYRYRWHTA